MGKYDGLPYPTAYLTAAERETFEEDLTVGELLDLLATKDRNLLVMTVPAERGRMYAARKVVTPPRSNFILITG